VTGLRVVRAILLTGVLSIVGLIGAEALRLGTIMIVSSATVVLSSIALGILIILRLSWAFVGAAQAPLRVAIKQTEMTRRR